MKHPRVLSAIAMLGVATIAGAFFPLSGGFDLSWRTIDGGGGTSTGGGFELSGTIGQPDAGVMSGGSFVLAGGFWVAFEPPCPWDCQAAPQSGAVDVPDLLALLGAWGGPQTPGTTCDFDGEGAITVFDLLKLLANWGPCP